MDTNGRFARIATATPEILERIDAILEGKEPFKEPQKPNSRLLTVAEACRELNMKYPTFHRAMQAGCFDVVTATGKALIRESSVHEFAAGLRHPSQEGLAARAEKNRLRRLARQNARGMEKV